MKTSQLITAAAALFPLSAPMTVQAHDTNADTARSVPVSAPVVSEHRIAVDKIRQILAGDLADADRMAQDNGDRSTCEGRNSPDMLLAIKTCWPVQQSYIRFWPLFEAFEEFRIVKKDTSNPAAIAAQARKVRQLSDSYIAAAGIGYPAEDLPLHLAYIANIGVSANLEEPEVALANAQALVALLEKTKMTDTSLFSYSMAVTMRDGLLAVVNTRKNLDKSQD